MALAGRNDACPCGSGRKYKRCCGFDRTGERRLEERLEAVAELARLPFAAPELLPLSDDYDAWVRRVLASEVEPRPVDAIGALGAEEPSRIVAACRRLFNDEWTMLSARCGEEAAAVVALIGGSVAAGLRDFRPVERFAVETVEETEELADDPFEALAMCLDGERLWVAEDGREAEREIDRIPEWVDDDDRYDLLWHGALDAVACRRATEWHGLRLTRLVARVKAQTPFEGFPRASAAVLAGCEAFIADHDGFHRRLAGTLLGDMVGREATAALRAALLAA